GVLFRSRRVARGRAFHAQFQGSRFQQFGSQRERSLPFLAWVDRPRAAIVLPSGWWLAAASVASHPPTLGDRVQKSPYHIAASGFERATTRVKADATCERFVASGFPSCPQPRVAIRSQFANSRSTSHLHPHY